MAENSSIEWTDATWNPTTGCDKVSPGCKNCYAERMAIRLKAMGQERYRNGFELTLQDDVVSLPLRWRVQAAANLRELDERSLSHEARCRPISFGGASGML